MSQAASQSPTAVPAAPAAPAAPTAPSAWVTATSDGQRIVTAGDVAALKARKAELSNLITSASERRAEVQDALREAGPGADRAGLEARLGVLDARIARLETEIDENSGQLASLDVTRFTTSSSEPELADGDDQPAIVDYGLPIAMAVIMFVLAPIAFAFSRIIWKRGSPPVLAPGSAEHAQRLERIEQAVDAIAIEVERVSEGQRFVTRLMSEGQAGAALKPGQRAMEPVRVGDDSLVNRR